jgi:hypothetical protein
MCVAIVFVQDEFRIPQDLGSNIQEATSKAKSRTITSPVIIIRLGNPEESGSKRAADS